ncbi:MAG: protein kinase [Acidobacteriota bacterium]|nr:protein kinase [Acidobacteriota bacterium]
MLAADTILQGRYRVARPLGQGGMGAVYEATDLRLSRTVALKETLAETDELRRAFEREARLLANLRHPSLPKVLDHFTEGAGMFLLMEFIPGDDLGRMLEERGRSFAPDEVLRWAEQLLGALEYLHSLDPPVLHRDIKPSNLKLVSRDQIILLDFGLAKGSAGQMTRTGDRSVLGYSPNYSPLEQIQGAGTDERSDLYALGATLYHLMTNVRPPDALTRATAVLNGQPDPLRPAREINEQVPAAASAALTRALALNVEQRPRAASEMRDDLRGTTPRVAATVPMTDADERTKVSLPSDRAGAIVTRADSRERGRRVVVPLPEETVVTQKGGGSGWKLLLGISLVTVLAALSAVLYLSYLRNGETGRTQANQPAVPSSPSPSPTPVVNSNRQSNINSEQPAGPAELAARAKLERRGIPYTEESFNRVVEDGNTGAVDLFLAAGMNPDATDATGRTVLIKAASKGRNNISRKLLGRGADVNARDGDGSTALMEASLNNHKDTVKVLLENGADVNLRDDNEQTALLRAAIRGHSEVVRMLLNRGARIDIKDKDGRDALAWAEINKRSDVIDLLKKAGATRY